MNRREAILLAVRVLLQKGYGWLACDKDGTIVAYEIKPLKMTEEEWWNYDSEEPKLLLLDNAHDLNFVKWEDEEPTNIAEWIKKEEEEMKNRREATLLVVKVLLQKGYEWLACDKDGTIVAYEIKPFKMTDDEWWNYDSEAPKFLTLDNAHDINFVKWEDEEPVNIREWLEKEEEEMKMYSVKDGELECREVDADFFEKNTTLGGLLDRDNKNGDSITTGALNSSNMWWDTLTGTMEFTNPTASDKLELDRDDCSEANTRNSGKGVILEKAKLIREALEKATDYGYKPSVSIVDDNYTLKTNGQILDVASMYPKPLSLADLDNVKVHDRICLGLNNIYEKKNSDYGNSFENSLDKHGLIAGIVRMDDKMSRLISLNSKKEQQVMDESLRDTLMDLANYAIMSVMWLDEQ